MKIGFYGHSNCAYRSEESFLDIVAQRLNAEIVNTGVRQGSEERILYELKKTKDLDLAIIFHSEPHCIFIPNSDRDLTMKQLTSDKAEYLFKDFGNQYHQLHHKKFTELFKTSEELKLATYYLKTYFYHPDLLLNRYYGSVMQIDKYLIDKQLPVIHILEKEESLPQWLKLSSGIVDYKIMQITKDYAMQQGERFTPNCMTNEGNLKVAESLETLIKQIITS
jgi:hypothetical protein